MKGPQSLRAFFLAHEGDCESVGKYVSSLLVRGPSLPHQTMSSKGTDCIAAIATPAGQGAIAVIRISGSAALAVAESLFRGKTPLAQAPGYSVHHGRIVNARGELLDEGLATVFREPQSYTGENIVEISCHGGTVIARSILEAALEAGARQAEPGEFTKRAFLNGKMDLSQAEAVADLVAAGSRKAQRASLGQLEGKLGAAINELREELLSLCALLEVELEFSEEGIALIAGQEMTDRIRRVDERVGVLIGSFGVGRIFREGVSVVLAGKPNAGKSSLFNALLQEERAIVTAHPGTTRDTIEESLSISGVMFRVTDTAGLREAESGPEAEGVKRARATLGSADIVLLVIDAAEDPDVRGAKEFAERLSADQKLVVAYNKSDLLKSPSRRAELLSLYDFGSLTTFTSARSGEGIHGLRKLFVHAMSTGYAESPGDLYVTNERHYRALLKAQEGLRSGQESIHAGRTSEFIAFDIKEAVLALSEITGQITTDDILNSIFSRFCIGK